ncbi:hypothetical protein LCGC14_1535380, partial [marine sediment metagenome]
MKIIIDLLGFRSEVEVPKHTFIRGEIIFPSKVLLKHGFQPSNISANISANDIKLRFEFMGYEDGTPLF